MSLPREQDEISLNCTEYDADDQFNYVGGGVYDVHDELVWRNVLPLCFTQFSTEVKLRKPGPAPGEHDDPVLVRLVMERDFFNRRPKRYQNWLRSIRDNSDATFPWSVPVAREIMSFAATGFCAIKCQRDMKETFDALTSIPALSQLMNIIDRGSLHITRSPDNSDTGFSFETRVLVDRSKQYFYHQAELRYRRDGNPRLGFHAVGSTGVYVFKREPRFPCEGERPSRLRNSVTAYYVPEPASFGFTRSRGEKYILVSRYGAARQTSIFQFLEHERRRTVLGADQDHRHLPVVAGETDVFSVQILANIDQHQFLQTLAERLGAQAETFQNSRADYFYDRDDSVDYVTITGTKEQLKGVLIAPQLQSFQVAMKVSNVSQRIFADLCKAAVVLGYSCQTNSVYLIFTNQDVRRMFDNLLDRTRPAVDGQKIRTIEEVIDVMI